MAARAILLPAFASDLFVVTFLSTEPRGSAAPVATEPAAADANAKALFCGFGGVGITPMPTPPDFESQFAVAVVEINSTKETANLAVSDFVLLDQTGKAAKFKRVVEVEVFDRPRVATEGSYAYHLNPGGTRSWKGILPAGKIRLRIKVALTSIPAHPVRFRLTIGPYVIEGPVDCEWPT